MAYLFDIPFNNNKIDLAYYNLYKDLYELIMMKREYDVETDYENGVNIWPTLKRAIEIILTYKDIVNKNELREFLKKLLLLNNSDIEIIWPEINDSYKNKELILEEKYNILIKTILNSYILKLKNSVNKSNKKL